MGGALNFKGDKKKKKSKKKKSQKIKHSFHDGEEQQAVAQHRDIDDDNDDIEELTEAEKKARKRRLEREKVELAVTASKSHRERVEEFNEKLGKLTELNDIPRVRLLHIFWCFFFYWNMLWCCGGLLGLLIGKETRFFPSCCSHHTHHPCFSFFPIGECCRKRLDGKLIPRLASFASFCHETIVVSPADVFLSNVDQFIFKCTEFSC